jgi:hypothetical protein
MSTTPPPAGPPQPYRKSTPPSNREVTITASQVQPPSPLYLQPEDFLFVEFFYPTFVPNANFLINYRFLRPDGEIVSSQKQIPFSGTASFTTLFLGEGYLLSLTLSTLGTLPKGPGAIWTIANIVRNVTGTPNINFNLIADYLSTTHFPAWPYGALQFSEKGPGTIRSFNIAPPAAGLNFNIVVPTSTRWRLIAINASFAASGVAGNRILALTIDNSTVIYFTNAPVQTVAPATSTNFCVANIGNVQLQDAQHVSVLIPDMLFLDAGHRVRSAVIGMDAADQWGTQTVLIQEWVSI